MILTTKHGSVRLQQRGISIDDIQFVVENSKPIYKQGFRFYSLKKLNHFCDNEIKRSQLINLIVLVKEKEQNMVLITAYKNEKGLKKIKKKSKRLVKRKEYLC